MPSTSEAEDKRDGRWIPFAVVAVTCVGLTAFVPLYLRKKSLSLTAAVPPPRRASGNLSLPSFDIQNAPPKVTKTVEQPVTDIDGFRPMVHAVKALGIATLFVTAGAASVVFGLKSYLGVQNADEFAKELGSRIRLILTKVPARKHAMLDPESEPALSTPLPIQNWTWPEAEKRITSAYEKDGLGGWLEAALREAEAEGLLENERRQRMAAEENQKVGK